MDIKCNCSLPSKDNGECVYEGKFRKNNNPQIKMLRFLKDRQKSDSFATRFEQQFNATTSRTYLCKYMTFKVVK